MKCQLMIIMVSFFLLPEKERFSVQNPWNTKYMHYALNY